MSESIAALVMMKQGMLPLHMEPTSQLSYLKVRGLSFQENEQGMSALLLKRTKNLELFLFS
jgi:hypothetical protein